MDIQQKISELIPPNNAKGRYEFSNMNLIDELSDEERHSIEMPLIAKLLKYPTDILIVQTLAYMKVQFAIPALTISLKKCKTHVQRIIVAACIFRVNRDKEMMEIAVSLFQKLQTQYDLIDAFYYLRSFDNESTDNLIAGYVDNSDMLVSYNAKRVLTNRADIAFTYIKT